MKLEERELITKPIPQFPDTRIQLYKQYCPQIDMEFGFRNKNDGTIKIVTSSAAPLKALQNNEDYIN